MKIDDKKTYLCGMGNHITNDIKNTQGCRQTLKDLTIGVTYSFKVRAQLSDKKEDRSYSSYRNKKCRDSVKIIQKFLKIIYSSNNYFTGIDERGRKYCYSLSDFVTQTIRLGG